MVRPATSGEVAGVVRVCGEQGAPIAVQGGNTGMVGGAIPRSGEVVVSLARLDDLDPVDTLAEQVECGAGVTLERVQNAARAVGLDFPVDFAARGSATIGGGDGGDWTGGGALGRAAFGAGARFGGGGGVGGATGAGVGAAITGGAGGTTTAGAGGAAGGAAGRNSATIREPSPNLASRARSSRLGR